MKGNMAPTKREERFFLLMLEELLKLAWHGSSYP
jgi:hypothetical protein